MGEFSKLDLSYLKQGDILVSTTNAIVSTIIRTGMHSIVSHAMLYIGDGLVIEAIGEGVKINSLQNNIETHGYKNVMAYRYPSLTSNKATLIVSFAKRQKGKGYDFTGLAGAAESMDSLRMRENPMYATMFAPVAYGGQMIVHHFAKQGTFDNNNKYYCSELVFDSYLKSGIILINDPPYMSYPQQIIDLGNKGTLNFLGNFD